MAEDRGIDRDRSAKNCGSLASARISFVPAVEVWRQGRQAQGGSGTSEVDPEVGGLHHRYERLAA